MRNAVAAAIGACAFPTAFFCGANTGTGAG